MRRNLSARRGTVRRRAAGKRAARGRFAVLISLAALVLCAALMWQYVFRERYLKYAYPLKYTAGVRENASENGLDEWLVFAVVRTESRFNPNARSNIGALGLMQLTPDTFDWAQSKTAEDESLPAARLYDPEINLRYGTVVLKQLLDEFGREDTALAAYHAGRAKVKSWLGDKRYSSDGISLSYIPYDNTRAYVRNVLRAREIYAQLYGGTTS